MKRKKNTKKEEPNIRRVPRPLGVTLLSREYQQENNKDKLYQIQKIVTNEWAHNNFCFMGKPMTIDQIAKLIEWTPKKVMQHVVSPVKNWLTGNDMKEAYQVLCGLVLKFGMADRAMFLDQIGLLTRSQGDSYKPFISSEVNQALKLLDLNTKTLTATAGLFKPETSKVNINNQQALVTGNGTLPTTEHGKYIGPNEAVKLLEAHNPKSLLQDTQIQDAILAKEVPNDLPEIIATRQQGLDVDGHAKPIKKRLTKKAHSDRREIDGPIFSSPIIP